MQTLSGQRPTNNLSSQSRIIAFISILLFALAGLISGFAFGAFLHPGQQAQSPNQGQIATVPAPGQLTTPTPTSHTQHPVPLGIPTIDHVSYTEVADGTTSYNLSAQVVDQSGQGKPIHASDIICKLWLVQQIPNGGKFSIPTQILANVNALQGSITGTVQGQPFPEVSGLTFDSTTPQTHLCSAKGKGIWKYQVTSSVPAGVYDLVVLSDWNGVHYNWSWAQITVKH
ncbi:MAG TPA: hypothetical protein VK140_08110 [Ktedonobacteraceae bacterium]|nr:hypothetical protein [Ktedonobacteraceae bacterium]